MMLTKFYLGVIAGINLSFFLDAMKSKNYVQAAVCGFIAVILAIEDALNKRA